MALAGGTILGPYEIVEPLGSGGMGEVYRARDPRLGRDVAVKLIATDGPPAPDRLRRFETEARAAAQLSHPNVITVFDVGSHDGQPYLVLELLEGRTLREALRGHPPTLHEAVSWALETARGLGAAHARGIVHRDLKPENIFLTSDGRVKVLDFGLAKLREPVVSEEADRESPTETRKTRPGMVLGTVGYMAPEQVRGDTPDPRTDVFALGAVLFEVATGRRAFGGETEGDVLAAILRDEPPSMSSIHSSAPASLDTVLKRCLAKRPTSRFGSGGEAAAALEAVLASLEPGRTEAPTAEPRGPYPGLSSFTEADAARFFGREREVEALWATLRHRRLAGLIGPSGAGKTSFVRAGLGPSRPSGWGAIVATPGGAPLRALAQALVGELPSDPGTMRELLAFDDPEVAVAVVKKWRKAHVEALLVLDQFEELFTLNPPEVQERFAELLGRLISECDVHVLLSMRDDFLMRCDEQEALRPVFQALGPLSPLSEDGLRRALVEPAKGEGFAFEDEALVAEMLESVEGARGALPLLAFAVARLWERRDREKNLLTRKAYEQIGGVAGALAQHAEQTLERIGMVREPIVRELFRNLVTAQWTRAVADGEELLSVVPDRAVAGQVLDALIDARLLTSYEVREGPSGEDGEAKSRQKVEIVHESLLRAWPRLVRWQAQDEEGAVLRDQLKQAAHLWEERGRPEDLLWTGTSEREFEMWRDRYPGQLTSVEDEFAEAMVGRARRRKRVRRLAAAAAVVILAAIAAVMTVSRQQVARSRDQAEAEARRAEASKLLALAQARLEEDPTEALALTTASLELSDTEESRVFAVRALQTAPPAIELLPEIGVINVPSFSPDGGQLVIGSNSETLELRSADGMDSVRLPGHTTRGMASHGVWVVDDLLVTGQPLADFVHVWSSAGERLRTIEFKQPSLWQVSATHLHAFTDERGPSRPQGRIRLRSWALPNGEARELGHVDLAALEGSHLRLAPGGRGLVYARAREVRVRPLPGETGSDRLLGTHPAAVNWLEPLKGRPDELVSYDNSGEIRVWRSSRDGLELVRTIRRPDTAPENVRLDPTLRWVARPTWAQKDARLWALEALPGASPLCLRRSGTWYAAAFDFHPGAGWYAVTTHNMSRVTLWPLRSPIASVVDGYSAAQRPMAFSPDGRWLATTWSDSSIRLWPLPGTGTGEVRLLGVPEKTLWLRIVFDPRGRYLVAVGAGDRAYLAPLDGSEARRLPVFNEKTILEGAAVSPSGRFVATAFGFGEGERTLRIWDVETEELRLLDLPHSSPAREAGDSRPALSGYEGGVVSMRFGDEKTLYTAGDGGLRRWDLESGTQEVVMGPGTGPETHVVALTWGPDGRDVVAIRWDPSRRGRSAVAPRLLDLTTAQEKTLPGFPEALSNAALGEGSLLALADGDGVLRVGDVLAEERHLLLGHDGPVHSIDLSPDGRWVASAGEDSTLRLWPMPDLSKPPLHTLPHDELIAKLKSLTNLRAVRDPEAPGGWRIELGPFPGWEHVPSW